MGPPFRGLLVKCRFSHRGKSRHVSESGLGVLLTTYRIIPLKNSFKDPIYRIAAPKIKGVATEVRRQPYMQVSEFSIGI